MRFDRFSSTAAWKRGAFLFALASVLGGCASRPPVMVDPPPVEVRQRMDRVVLRVFSDVKPDTYAMDNLLVGGEEGAGYAAKNVAKVGAKSGLGIAAVGCNPGWGIFWLITCPYGAAAGAVVGVTTAVVGGAGGALYGAAQSRSQEEIDSAVATLDKSLLDIKLADDFRGQFMSATHKYTAARIIDDEPRDTTMRQALDDNPFPIIVAARVDRFTIIREGRLTPELSLQISVSADLFGAPEAGRRYARSWFFSTKLGDFYALTEKGGAGLRPAIDDALRTMAVTVVEDLFITTESVPVQFGKTVKGKVVTSSGREFASTREWFREQKQKAGCGNAEAQVALGEAYAAIDPRIYGWRAQDAMFDGYQWLRRAEMSGHGGPATANSLGEIKKHLLPGQVEEAERLAREWRPAPCGVNPDSKNGLESSESAGSEVPLALNAAPSPGQSF